jgi:hypothetical protein
VSLSDTHELRGLGLRKITQELQAWDNGAGSIVTLEPGVVLSSCQIHRDRQDGEPYVMEFQHSGKVYSCPLFRFQPRTQPIDVVGIGAIPAREAVAQ